jgi:superfamily II DNA/RNA helicase
MNSFAELQLHPQILKAIKSCGYITPTPIQSQAIPAILLNKDLVASAQTGTGKTAAFILPVLNSLCAIPQQQKQNKGKPSVLILTPTRELASQITATAKLYGKFLKFSIVSIVGGMSYQQQLKHLAQTVDIIIATPGRLLDYMRKSLIDLSAVKTLIFDEADRMLDMGFIDDVKLITKATPKQRQTLLFSATVDSKLDQIIKEIMCQPVRIDLSPKMITPAKIKQELYIADNNLHKGKLLQHFLSKNNIYKAIIFTATKIDAEKIAKQLRENNYPANALHGDLKQNVRNRTLDLLRSGKVQFLVATDVAARGIDIADITHVFNYDLPKFHEDYVHRIGRTGRAGKEGIAISFALPHDTRHIKKIERYTGKNLSLMVVNGLEPKHSMQAIPVTQNKYNKTGKSRRKANTPSENKPFWFKDKPKSNLTSAKQSGSHHRLSAPKKHNSNTSRTSNS